MSWRNIIVAGLIGLLVLMGSCTVLRKLLRGNGKTEYPYYCTAKKWYSYVEYKAKQWRPNAIFYGISDTEVNLDGEARKWEYLFDAPEANKQAIVKLEGGFISLKEDNRVALSSVKNWQLDSSDAVMKANAAGGKAFLEQNDRAKVYVSLLTEIPSTRQKRSVWFVKYQGKESLLYIIVDIATGTIISSQTMNYTK